MIVLHLANCPDALRGDLTKWLLEISTGIYVGRVSARIRDKLWERVVATCKNGRAVLVYNTNTEQGLDFRIHGDTWEPIDFDGLKLMMRPNSARAQKPTEPANHGFSDAAKYRTAKRFNKGQARYPETYVVFDLETTGLDPISDEIIEVGAIKVDSEGQISTFSALALTDAPLLQSVIALTSIDDDLIKAHGQPLGDILPKFLAFVGDLPLLAHNMSFDKRFLDNACAKHGFALISNRCIDTLSLSRRIIKGLASYKMEHLASHLELPAAHEAEPELQPHRSLGDCYMAHHLYQKLLKFMC